MPRIGCLERVTVALVGVYLVGVGTHALATGHLLYVDYVGWPVAAPVAIALGMVLIVAGLFMRS